MSAAIQKPGRNDRGARRRASSSERRRHALAQHAARQRQDRAEQRDRQQRRIINLLGRGAGISQILWEIGRPDDRPSASIARAMHVRRVLDAVADGSRGTRGVEIPPRDLTRIVAHLDEQITRLEHDAATQQRRAARRHAAKLPAARPPRA